MYLQITTRCNMSCAHCCFSCTAKGDDMSMDVVRAAVEFAEEYDGSISIGGGEPTLHKNFWEILGLCLGYSIDAPFIATNGSNTGISLALARMAKRGVLYAALSRDQWHDEIDDVVVMAFQNDRPQGFPAFGDLSDDCREIRDVSKNVSAKGRAEYWGWAEGCCCSDFVIDPHGVIWSCGCKEVSYGTVFDPKVPDDAYPGECCHEVEVLGHE